jgi:chemotaxis protein MotA
MADKVADKPAAKAAVQGSSGGGSKLDIASVAGLIIGLGGILGGLVLEGGRIKEIIAPTAFMIVMGGTMGAVMVTTPLSVLMSAMKKLREVFFEKSAAPEAMIDQIVDYATKARKNGIVSLEQDAYGAADPFLRKAMSLAVDGTDMQEIRKMMELEITLAEHHIEADAKVFEAAGGYSPTIGIIGAVLGLIQVMKNLANIDEVGHGIATAFIATIYGVGFANLFFLPAGNKIKARAEKNARMQELILEGVIGIVEGLNPKLIRGKLEPYGDRPEVHPAKDSKKSANAAKPVAAAAMATE